jgi:drug/metabolite transporter (DMT)-like permease
VNGGSLLGLWAGASWGVADFMGGLAGRRMPVLGVLLVAQAAGLAVLLVVVLIVRPEPPPASAVAWGVLAGLSALVALAAFYRALAIGTMSLVAPVSALSAALPVAFGIASGERPPALALIGAVVAVLGTVIASRAPGRASTTGLGLAIVSAIGFGAFFIFIDLAAADGALWAVTTSRGTTTVVTGCAILAGAAGLGADRRALLLAGSAGVIEAFASLAFAVATTRGLLSIVAVLAALYPVGTVALAHVVLHERLGRFQWVGVGLVLAGVVAITTASG